MSILRISGNNGDKTAVIRPLRGNGQLLITCCGFTSSADTGHIKRKHADICAIQYIRSGCGYLNVNGKIIKSRKGDVIINHLGEEHDYWCDKKDPWSKLWLNVRGTLVTELLRIYQLENITYVPNVPQLEEIFADCIDNLLASHTDVVEETAIALHRIIYNINKALYFSTENRDDIVEQLRHKLNQEVVSGKTFSEIAKEFNLSESQLSRRFKQTCGCSPYAWLLNSRMELAKNMLLSSSIPISEIAEKCGFKSQYYFSTLFKRKFKCSPKNYRKTPSLDIVKKRKK